VHGIVDNVQINGDGTVLIRDWKSNVHQDFLLRYQRQAQFYAHALRAQGRDVGRADIVDVAASDDQGQLVTYPVDTTNGATSQLIAVLERSLAGIAAGRFPANPCAASCSCCDMSRICSERWTNDAPGQNV
jgi:hypothetical protein